MNLYSVISEEIQTSAGCYEPPEPPEYGCIVELVAAETPGAAKWAAWRNDNHSFQNDPREMPRFSIVLVARNVDLTAGIYTHTRDPDLDQVWYAAMERQDGRPRPLKASA